MTADAGPNDDAPSDGGPGAKADGRPPSPAVDARQIVRRALKGTLATLDRGSGHPYASLVTLATDAGGQPIVLISRLALHTQNLLADDRASVLADGTAADGNPLAGGRVTVIGRARPNADEAVRRRFLARHPDAAGYAGFADFAFYVLDIERAHYVGGFGRIVSLDAAEAVVEVEVAEALLAGEADILAHMNQDHQDAVALYATALLGGEPGPWRMTGIDPEGCDIVRPGAALRLPFANRIVSPQDARLEFVRLARLARARLPGGGPADG